MVRSPVLLLSEICGERGVPSPMTPKAGREASRRAWMEAQMVERARGDVDGSESWFRFVMFRSRSISWWRREATRSAESW